jgi:hypothetical protein
MEMNDITTLTKEREDLSLHVDLCSQRYLLLEKRLAILEVKFDKLSDDVLNGRKSMATTIIGSTVTLVTAIAGLITTILMKF